MGWFWNLTLLTWTGLATGVYWTTRHLHTIVSSDLKKMRNATNPLTSLYGTCSIAATSVTLRVLSASSTWLSAMRTGTLATQSAVTRGADMAVSLLTTLDTSVEGLSTFLVSKTDVALVTAAMKQAFDEDDSDTDSDTGMDTEEDDGDEDSNDDSDEELGSDEEFTVGGATGTRDPDTGTTDNEDD